MPYSLAWLDGYLRSTEKVNYLFFWGPQPTVPGRIDASCLSQW